MTIVHVYGGPLKRDIIQLAYEECGQAGYEFELTPEEYASALRRLDALMAEWRDHYGICIGYNFPDYGHGSPEDESGIPRADVNVVSTYLAMRIAPAIGKTMSGETRGALARSFEAFRAKHQRTPMQEMARGTPRGSGNRYWNNTWPYFTTHVSPREPRQ